MRILMLTPRFPYPPHRGDTVRSWHVLSNLAQRHEVWLACVDRRPPAAEHLAVVRTRCRDLALFARSAPASLWCGALSWLLGHSITEGYFIDPRLTQTLREWSARVAFDAVLTYSSSIAPAAECVAAPRRVLDLCDVDSAKWEVYARRSLPPLRWLYRSEASRVARLEARAAHAHELALVVNERERRKLAGRLAHVPTAVLPTAVALQEYAALPTTPAPEPVVSMIGSMFYPPNVRAVHWFGRYVWPRVRAAVPAAHWLIVGADPTRAVRAWGRQPGTTVTGYVPDVRPYLAKTRVFVNAVDGDIGVQSKLVVALAAARPAVVTPDSAAGLVYRDPPPFLIAGSPGGFADAVIRLLRDPAAAERLAQRARAVAREQYDAAEHVRRVEAWLGAAGPTTAAQPANRVLGVAHVEGARL
jgi:sugar transferase (PEP-CTERM/EpsH1 system associated)